MKKTLLLLLMSLLASPVGAARLVIPDIFELLAVDGKQTERSFLAHIDTVELSEGVHKIALRYMDVVMDPDLGYETVVNSPPFIITLNTKAGETYKLEPAREAYRDREAFVRNPLVRIRNEADNQNLAIAIDKPEEQLGRWVRETSMTPKPADRQSMAGQAENAEKPELQAVSKAGEKLKYWWLRADKKTRQAFMSWIVGNQH
ncbi:MAG: DUF2057 domain-containing protein [Candidatus Thiodiazotropha sp. (ex Epidulcina cf. delphinae)]|nr:DUF2057 domain-containing protein [Candidatus Thiodiazotropha sp. (ex Epidulcina cf. delphinae)]